MNMMDPKRYTHKVKELIDLMKENVHKLEAQVRSLEYSYDIYYLFKILSQTFSSMIVMIYIYYGYINLVTSVTLYSCVKCVCVRNYQSDIA